MNNSAWYRLVHVGKPHNIASSIPKSDTPELSGCEGSNTMVLYCSSWCCSFEQLGIVFRSPAAVICKGGQSLRLSFKLSDESVYV